MNVQGNGLRVCELAALALFLLASAGCGGGGGEDSSPPVSGGPSAPDVPATPQQPSPPDPADPQDPADSGDPEEETPPLEAMAPERTWSFSVRTPFGAFEEVLSGKQIGGQLEELIDFGFAASGAALKTFSLDLPRDNEATGHIFGTADGATYGVYTEAPFSPASGPNPVGSDARLTQKQAFIKRADNATLSFTITSVVLSAGEQEFAQPQPTRQIPIIAGFVLLEVSAYKPGARNLLFTRRAYADLVGRFGAWARDAETIDSSGGPLWTVGDFDFSNGLVDDPVFGEISAAVLSFREPRTFTIDLSDVDVGGIVVLSANAIASADNFRAGFTPQDGQASFSTAFLRDPLSMEGTTIRFTGLEPVTGVDMTAPAEEPREPEACTRTPNPDPAAGTLQFSAPEYFVSESANIPRDLLVTRTGGSSGAVSATLTSSDGTAVAGAEYARVSRSVTFGDGDATHRVIQLDLIRDGDVEADKTFTLTLSDPGGCVALGAQRTATVTILDDDSPPPAQSFTIGGTVSGLVGTELVLRDTSFLSITPVNGPFTFASPIASGQPYEVTVITQPTNPAQICTVTNGSGVVAEANVTNIEVTCETPPAVGSLDGGFGELGKVTAGLPGGATAIARQSDGKILAVGGLRLARYNSDGTVDASFGTAGLVTVTFSGGGTLDRAQDVAVQGDGKILVAGFTRVSGNDDFALARYNADGTPDTSFGTAGKASVDFAGSGDQASSVLVQSDGRIVLAGHAGTSTPLGVDNDFAVARFTSAGVLDGTFGTAGKSRTDFGGRSDLGLAAALQSDDKIVVVGRFAQTGGSFEDTGAARYNANGTLDTSFANAGILRRNLSFNGLADQATDIAIQPDGKILLAGFAQEPSSATFGHSTAFLLSRYNADGTDDASFSGDGDLRTLFTSGNDFGRGLALQADGKIVVVGQSSNSSLPDFAIARYESNGALDASFGTGGLFGVDFFGSGDDAKDILIQPDGKLVVAGSATNASSTVMGMIRINP